MKTEYSLSTAGRGKRPRKPIEIMMTPMIDVIFLLLVFFLVASSFDIPELLMPSGVSELNSPQSGATSEAPPDPSDDIVEQIVIKILASPDNSIVYELEGQPLGSFDELKERLNALSRASADVPVIIDPEQAVKAKFVVRTYDLSRQLGLSRVFLATRPPAQ